jgi:hypothetical protein
MAKWIQKAIKHPGALHRSLDVPQGKKIPAGKIERATHSPNPTLRKRAVLAQTLRSISRHDEFEHWEEKMERGMMNGGDTKKCPM